MATHTLKGSTEIYAAVQLIDQPRAYGETTARKGEQYWICQVNGRGMTVGKDFRDAYVAGTLVQMTFTETKYSRKDLATGEMVDRDSATIGNFITQDQLIKMMKGEASIIKAQAELDAMKKVSGKLAEIELYKEAGLDATTTKQLMELVG